MKSSKFNENLANLKLQHFLGPPVWEPGPKILGGPAGAPKRPVRCPVGHHFGGVGGDALRVFLGQVWLLLHFQLCSLIESIPVTFTLIHVIMQVPCQTSFVLNL
jgi:hypothetical protein